MSRRREQISTTVLDRARAGDHEAFTAVIRHYDPGLRALAYRLLGDRERMDDALQEAYVKAFRALPGFRGDSSLGTWLYRIAYNACLDELDRDRELHELPLAESPELPDPRADLAESVTTRRQLTDGLAQLTPTDRAAVLLVDAHGFDYRTAAEVLDVPAGTIASRLNRARAALRRALGKPTEGIARR